MIKVPTQLQMVPYLCARTISCGFDISLIIINGNGFNPIVKTPIYINENTIKRFILLWFIAIPIMKAVTETKTVDVIRSGLRGKL